MKSSLSWSLMVIAACCAAASAASAAEKSIELTVDARDYDRQNAPVRVLIDAPEDAKSATLADPQGKELPGQLTAPGLLEESASPKRQLHFILPKLAKGETIKLTATFSDESPTTGFAWKDTPGEYADLSYDGQPVMRYMYKELDPDNREIAGGYAALQRRQTLEDRLRAIWTDYETKLSTNSPVDARDALRTGLEILLDPESGVAEKAHPILQQLVRPCPIVRFLWIT